eukprot:341923-Prymnesium_polylepis.1
MSSPSGSISTPTRVSSCSKSACVADTWRPKRRCSPHTNSAERTRARVSVGRIASHPAANGCDTLVMRDTYQ